MSLVLRQPFQQIVVTPTLDTAAYASGDRLGSIMSLTNIAYEAGSAVVLDEVVVIDGDKQSQAIDILFFDALPTVASADNAAIDVSDAEMIAKCIGVISIATSDYKALAANSVASVRNLRLNLDTTSNVNTVWALMVCRSGTPTYTASGMTLKFKILQD